LTVGAIHTLQTVGAAAHAGRSSAILPYWTDPARAVEHLSGNGRDSRSIAGGGVGVEDGTIGVGAGLAVGHCAAWLQSAAAAGVDVVADLTLGAQTSVAAEVAVGVQGYAGGAGESIGSVVLGSAAIAGG
jgi:hypothetical protein